MARGGLVVFEMERHEQFNELSLLWAWGVELCRAIVVPSQVRSHLLARMQVAALRHTEMVGELAMLRAAVIDVSYAAPQAHEIVNVALHREYSTCIVFIFSQGRKYLYHI
jgi:hypothetical protein